LHPLSWRTRGFYKSISLGAEPNPFISFTFRWPQYRIWAAPLEALVDTGSPFTAIATRDAERYQIPFSKLNRDQKLRPIGFAGLKFILKLAKNTELTFKDEEGKRHTIQYEPLYILEPDLSRGLWREKGVYRLPNVIGMDFLRHQKVKFYMDPASGEFELEFPGQI
jgi:hypothetical protein